MTSTLPHQNQTGSQKPTSSWQVSCGPTPTFRAGPPWQDTSVEPRRDRAIRHEGPHQAARLVKPDATVWKGDPRQPKMSLCFPSPAQIMFFISLSSGLLVELCNLRVWAPWGHFVKPRRPLPPTVDSGVDQLSMKHSHLSDGDLRQRSQKTCVQCCRSGESTLLDRSECSAAWEE